MEIFDKRFVHFMWNPALKGKRGFLSSGIDTLIKMVNEDSDRTEIQKGCERDLPFCKHITVECRLAYYDPNYSVKWAYYKEGKKIQVTPKGTDKWVDLHCEPKWDLCDEYRIKPEADKMPPTWTNPHDCNGCLYEKQSGMEEPCSDCVSKRLFIPKEKQYRPYESSAEMIVDFIDRFKVNCPSYCEPLIWVKSKESDARYLIDTFRENIVRINNDMPTCSFWMLFEYYTYLDGSPVGMEVKE